MKIVLCFLKIFLVLKNVMEIRATLLFTSRISRFYDSTTGLMTPDRFSLPAAVCTGSVKCNHYGAVADIKNKCRCICPTTKPTIGMFNGTWACTNDTAIRKNEGTTLDLLSTNEIW